jgi:hypothetical protein
LGKQGVEVEYVQRKQLELEAWYAQKKKNET